MWATPGGCVSEQEHREACRRHMRVKLCSRCPYAPRDLADHYDPDAAPYACARCDSELEVLNPSGPCEARWRRQCSTGLDITSTITPSVAPFATESLASSVTTPGGLPYVRKNASIDSGPAGRATPNGCADFAPPDYGVDSGSVNWNVAPGPSLRTTDNRPP